MLQRVSTTLVALSLVASAGQASPVIGDEGAFANQVVANNQDATSVNHGGFALTVIGDKGTTLVNRGRAPAVTGTTELKPGDRILVRNGAGARITYPDGGNVPVRGVATVDPLSPCDLAADLPSRKAPPEPYVPPVAEEPFRYWPLAGLALAGAGIGAAVALTSHNNNNNFRPPALLPESPLPLLIPYSEGAPHECAFVTLRGTLFRSEARLSL